MKTPDEVFQDWKGRRRGILRALLNDIDSFHEQCTPERENLCLYGHPDGTWTVDLPAEEVPPEMPEPALGINFARDGMQRRDWLALLAVHSDTWLLAVAFYNGARLNKEGRDFLFELMNEYPTIFEIVSGKAGANTNNGPKGGIARKPARSIDPRFLNKQPGERPSHPGQHMQQRQAGPPHMAAPSRKRPLDEEEEEEDDQRPEGDSEWEEGDGDPCPNCGAVYRKGDFWIACDFCDTWYDGKCVQMTPQKAQKMGKWRCPQCD